MGLPATATRKSRRRRSIQAAEPTAPEAPGTAELPARLTIMRYYNNGDHVRQSFPRAEALAQIEYSKRNRPGCALFIGCECVQVGYLGEERCAAISAELRALYRHE